jgi:integrase
MNSLKPIDAIRILTRHEIATTIADLKRKSRRSANTRQNLAIFRLSTCCGLRVSEIVGLTLANVRLAGQRPHLYVPKAIAKRGKARRVPLWWDAATLADLLAWKVERVQQGAKPFHKVRCCNASDYRQQDEGTGHPR